MIKKFIIRKDFARFRDNIWASDLAEMISLSCKNLGVKHLLCVIGIFSEYEWVSPLKDKKCKKGLNGFMKIVNESKRKPNNIWVDQGKWFYNSFMQKWLHDNDILTLFRMVLFRSSQGWMGGANRPPAPKICHIYPKMMKVDTAISYWEKIQKIYKSSNAPNEICYHHHFFTRNLIEITRNLIF